MSGVPKSPRQYFPPAWVIRGKRLSNNGGVWCGHFMPPSLLHRAQMLHTQTSDNLDSAGGRREGWGGGEPIRSDLLRLRSVLPRVWWLGESCYQASPATSPQSTLQLLPVSGLGRQFKCARRGTRLKSETHRDAGNNKHGEQTGSDEQFADTQILTMLSHH